MDEAYCKIFIDSDESREALGVAISQYLGGQVQLRAITSPTLDLDVIRNDCFDPVKRYGDFVYFRYYLEIEPTKGSNPADFPKHIAGLLEWCWARKMPAVAACDFEAVLPWKGGIEGFPKDMSVQRK
jgi:hypothetical protein